MEIQVYHADCIEAVTLYCDKEELSSASTEVDMGAFFGQALIVYELSWEQHKKIMEVFELFGTQFDTFGEYQRKVISAPKNKEKTKSRTKLKK